MEYLRRAGRAVVEQRRTMVALSLLLYVGLYLAVSLGGINFQVQPALASYDQGPPDALLWEPAEGAILSTSSVDLNASGDDPDNVDDLNITYSVDTSVVGEENFVCDECYTIHTESLSDGSHTWNITVCDSAGDCNASHPYGDGQRSFTVDTTPPSVTASHSPSDPNTTTTVTVTGEASDATTSVTEIRVYVDDTLQQTCGSSPCDYSSTYSSGTHTYYVEADDEAGNTGRDPSSGTHSFTVNDPPNEPTDPDPSDGGVVATSSPSISALYDDPDGDSGTLEYYNDSDGVQIGSCSVSDASRCSVTWSGLADGSHAWYAVADDGVNPVTNQSSVWSFTVDTNNPSVSVSINTSNPGVDEPVEITADASDSTTNVQQIRIYVNATEVDSCTVDSPSTQCVTEVGPYAEGSAHSYNATATDEAGNTGASSIQEFNVNNRPNEPSSPNPSDGAVEADSTPDLNVTYTDPDGEDGYVEFYVNGSFEGSCSSVSDGNRCGIITGTLAEGLHDWHAIAYDAHDDQNQSPTWTFTVDTSASTQITGPSESAWQTSDFTVSVDDSDDAQTCQYRIDDGNDGSFETGWTDRSCPDGGFTVSVGSSGDCTVEGTNECHVEVNMTDDAGNTASDTADFDIDHSPPTITCDECDIPDPVKSGTDITFAPSVNDAASGTDLVEICEDDTCSDTFCTYSPDTGGTSCDWPTPDATYENRDYCIQATDQVGHQSAVVCGSPQHNFTVKKWVGDSCQADVECLLGACSGGVCRVTIIPPPSIILTSFAGTTDIQRASVGPSGTAERPRTLPQGAVRRMNVTLSNPLSVPDRLYVSFEGSAVARGLVDVQDVNRPGLSCSRAEEMCTVFLDAEEERTVQIPVRGMRPSRGMLEVSVTSATSEKSARVGVPVVVRQRSPLDFLRSMFNGLL